MAIVTGGLERLLLKYPELDPADVRFVGWGAGQIFRYNYPFIQTRLPLAYTVCPNPQNWGTRVHGVDVRPPQELLGEDPRTTVVAVFAERYFDVMHALRDDFNDLRCVNACGTADDEGLFAEMEAFRGLDLRPGQRQWTGRPRIGIFFQGMASRHTPYVLAWHRLHFPDAYLCMATWDHVDPDVVAQCRPWLDHLQLAPPPADPGRLYLNAGLRSARLGLEHLAEVGVEFSVRGRTDCVLTGSIHRVLERYFSRGRALGKLAISINSMHQLPFMFSEKAMLGRTSDLLRLWSMPEIPTQRSEVPEAPPSAHFLELRRVVPECLLWSHYARDLGYPTETLEDSHAFLRERLLPLEPHLGWASLKFIPLFTIHAQRSLGYTLEQWDEIRADPEGARERARALQDLDMTIEDFWARKVG